MVQKIALIFVGIALFNIYAVYSQNSFQVYNNGPFLENGLLRPELNIGPEQPLVPARPGLTNQVNDDQPRIIRLEQIPSARRVNNYMEVSPMSVVRPSDNTPHATRFNLFRYSYSNRQFYLVEPRVDGNVATYWLPQGQYIDIPARPTNTEPEFLFTPALSGCSIAIDSLNDTHLRVYHVEGGREASQYNDLQNHGRGLILAIRYNQYGYTSRINPRRYVENVHGLAYLRYHQSDQLWYIHYHSYDGSPLNPTIVALEGIGRAVRLLVPESESIGNYAYLSINPNQGTFFAGNVRRRLMTTTTSRPWSRFHDEIRFADHDEGGQNH